VERIKILILSDSPIGPSGLGRIARELALRMVEIPEIELGFCGLGSTWAKGLPFPFYPTTRRNGYVLEDLPQIWTDFAGGDKGVLLTIWNHTWLGWLTDPRYCPPYMRDWIKEKPFDLWGYMPVDSTRSDGTLPGKNILEGFDRVLAYTQFGSAAIEKTICRGPIANLPHGLDTAIFYPQDRISCRRSFGLPDEGLLIGIVATNSERKDWGLAFEVAGQIPDAILWCHTDRANGPEAYWDLHDLAKIHGVDNRLVITTFHYIDSRMAQMYSACDVTLGIGHEGHGLPLSESLGCGTPIVTMNWAGQTDFTPKEMMVTPSAFHQTGPGSYLRPVHSSGEWVYRIKDVLILKGMKSLLPARFEWQNCWPKWKEWILQGVSK